MTIEFLLGTLAVVTAFSAVLVVFSRSMIHMALFMMLTIVATSGMILLLNMEIMSAIMMWIFGGSCLILLLNTTLLIHLKQTEKSARKIPISKLFFLAIITYFGTRIFILSPALDTIVPSSKTLQFDKLAEHLHAEYGFLTFLVLVTLFTGLAASILMVRKE